MDLGDYLYLIIVLGVALFQFVSKSLGNKEMKRDVIRDNDTDSPKTKRKTKKEAYVIDTLNQVNPAVNDYVKTEFNTYMPTSDILHNQAEDNNMIKGDKCENSSSLFNLSDYNELKKAIIYGEIFGRKF